ncbi:MAG TPA: TonB family protein [Noviherbaspirillum sp.]|nr:TonB family protein [Noviherbaspirillum sp.]
MKTRIALIGAAAIVAGCATRPDTPPPAEAPPEPEPPAVLAPTPRPEPLPASPARSIDEYKRVLARHIAARSPARVFDGRPQALLRSVIVLRYTLDADGNLVQSEVMRSNRDRETEATALATLRAAAPFPRPADHLLHRGRIEISETWLFNNDGRFQLRTIAERQMDR